MRTGTQALATAGRVVVSGPARPVASVLAGLDREPALVRAVAGALNLGKKVRAIRALLRNTLAIVTLAVAQLAATFTWTVAQRRALNRREVSCAACRDDRVLAWGGVSSTRSYHNSQPGSSLRTSVEQKTVLKSPILWQGTSASWPHGNWTSW